MFGEFIKQIRAHQRLGLREFCLEHGHDPSNWSKIEREVASPPRDEKTLRRWATQLGIKPDTDDWLKFFDYAAVDAGRIPDQILEDEDLVAQLPVLFRTLSGQRTLLNGKIQFNPCNLPDSFKQKCLQEDSPQYALVTLEKPIQQSGQAYSFAVLPCKLNPRSELEQCGKCVLFQSEAEAKESYTILSGRNKKHLAVMQTAGLGSVGWVRDFRRVITEIMAWSKPLPDGRKVWLAVEREVDKDSLEISVKRRRVLASQNEAVNLAKQWQNDYDREKRKHQAAMAKNLTPPQPPRTTRLIKADMDALAGAKQIALQRQWRHCFELFEKRKASPNCEVTDQQFEDAYLLDLVEQGGDLKSCAGDSIRADKQLISALQRAMDRFAKREKSKITDSAVYMIAFNWELGWCYLSDKQIARKLAEVLETPFSSGQVKQYRFRTLGLLAKHLPGPPTKSP